VGWPVIENGATPGLPIRPWQGARYVRIALVGAGELFQLVAAGVLQVDQDHLGRRPLDLRGERAGRLDQDQIVAPPPPRKPP